MAVLIYFKSAPGCSIVSYSALLASYKARKSKAVGQKELREGPVMGGFDRKCRENHQSRFVIIELCPMALSSRG